MIYSILSQLSRIALQISTPRTKSKPRGTWRR